MSKGVAIGLDRLTIAVLKTDPAAGTGKATYEATKRIAGAITANLNPNASMETLFADDGPFDTAATMGQISLELNVADLDFETQALLLGHTLDTDGVLISKSNDTPPWVAVGFRSLKSNGKYRYLWLAKGKFGLPELNNETKADSITWNTPTITGSFVKRECDDEWKRQLDEDQAGYTPQQGEDWFLGPYGEAPTP
ncbi:Phage major tail protein [compost metagenome]